MTSAAAITIAEAMALAYNSNPQLNAQRSLLRATDEKVPQALSGYRPRLSLTASSGLQRERQTSEVGAFSTTVAGQTTPYSVGFSANQSIFDGFQTTNKVRAAEAEVSSGREALRIIEQTVLLASASAYMSYLRDVAILSVNRSNVRNLETVLTQTNERYSFGEVTKTDIAQTRTQLAAARTQLAAAESILASSAATYIKVIGITPAGLAPAPTVDRLGASSLDIATRQALINHPRVVAAALGIDVAYLQVKISEGALFPNLGIGASVQQQYNPSIQTSSRYVASVTGQLVVPIYQGGAEYSLIRQSKETLAQQRHIMDQVVREVRVEVAQQWALSKAAQTQLRSATDQVASAETALDGVREEARYGQRTTTDVLNAQQALIVARIALINAQHDRLVSSYGLLSAIGKLSPIVLKLPVTPYDALEHYTQVRDSWAGLRVPDQR